MTVTRTCLIGISGFGAVHYNDLLREVGAGRMQVVAATVINQGEEAGKCAHLRELGCRLFTDYREMLQWCRGRADLCLIPTGIPLHAPMTIDALRAGLHVLVEKPAAGSIQDVQAMCQAAREAGRIVGVAFQQLYSPDTMEAKRALLGGAIGRIEMIKGWALWPRPDSYYRRNGWAGRLRSGDVWVLDSPFNNALAHELVLMLFLAGNTERSGGVPVEVEAGLYRAHQIESCDTACLRIRTDTGLPVLFFVTHASRTQGGSEIEIRGSAGRIHITRSGVTIQPRGGAETILASPGHDTLRSGMLQAINAAARGEDSFYCGLELASLQTQAVVKAHEAAPIQDVGKEFVQRIPSGDSVNVVIQGVDEAVARGFAEEKLFHELGVPWAPAVRAKGKA
jgi:predicted dehydrogenase